MTEMRGMAAPDATAAAMAAPVSGVRLLAETFFVPKGWDVTESFGGVDGSVSGYLGNQKLALATRVGGRTLWGAYPWFESASISGDVHDVRGYYDGRYRGDSSLYGNAELRWWIGKRKGAVLPVRWGLTTFCESGRVWYADESSKKWHTGYGLGLMLQLIGTPMALSRLDGQRHRGHPVLRRGRLLVLRRRWARPFAASGVTGESRSPWRFSSPRAVSPARRPLRRFGPTPAAWPPPPRPSRRGCGRIPSSTSAS